MTQIDAGAIHAFLEELGRRYADPARLLLLGGTALNLLGHPRPTVDIDYVGDDLAKDALQRTIESVAADLHLEVEAVPIGHFVPLPAESAERDLWVGRFGVIDVYVLDPYVIALSKVDRGFDVDIEDVVFLVQRGLLNLDRLEDVVGIALEQASTFGMDPVATREHLAVVRRRSAAT